MSPSATLVTSPIRPLRPAPALVLRPGADGLRVLELAGSLPDDWCVHLTRGLAARNVGLVRGHARRAGRNAWAAELTLEGVDEEALPDLLALAADSPHPLRQPIPALLDFELAREGGTLHVEVEAWDAVGLLAAVLERVERAGLRCTSLEFETLGGLAFQALSLRRLDGGGVPARARVALGLELARLLV